MTEETNNAAEGTPEVEMVPLPEADDADIDAFLENALKGEGEDVEIEAAPEPEKPSPQPEAQPKPQQDVRTAPAQSETTPPADVEKLREQVRQKELMIQRQANELGDIRKQLKAAKEQLSQGLNEKFIENPAEGMKDFANIQKIDDALVQVDKQEQELVAAHQAQVLVSQHIKPGDASIQDMCECLQEDGLDPQFIQTFGQNPWVQAAPETIIHLAKRAQYRRILKKLLPAYETLLKEKQQWQKKPGQMIDQVSKELKRTPSVNAASGGSSKVDHTPNINPAMMSDAELEELLSKSA